jgi:hypothetical protein
MLSAPPSCDLGVRETSLPSEVQRLNTQRSKDCGSIASISSISVDGTAISEPLHPRVITSAHRINQGSMPDLNRIGPESDFYFVPADDPETAVGLAISLARRH